MGFVDGATGKRLLLPVVEADEGANATLECRAGGIPLPNITWVSQSADCFGTFLPELVYRVTILVGEKTPVDLFPALLAANGPLQ